MSDIEKALSRLDAAVARLLTTAKSTAAQRAATASAEAQIKELAAERDRLKAEIRRLNKQHDDDTMLRGEAAEAVKEALRDLRGLVAAQESAGGAKQHA